jgi:hypothetical protein
MFQYFGKYANMIKQKKPVGNGLKIKWIYTFFYFPDL